MPSLPLPRSVFETDAFPARDRFSAWQESMGVLFDIAPSADTGNDAFFARVDCYQLHRMLIAETRSRAARYDRKESRIRRDGLDLIMIQLFTQGEVQFGTRCGSTVTPQGQLVVFDMGQFIENHNSIYTNLTLAFPREVMEAYLPDIARWHGCTIPDNHAATRLLKNLFLATFQQATGIDARDSQQIEQAMCALTAAALNPRRYPDATHGPAGELLSLEIKRHINRNLGDSKLSIDTICRAFAVSRTQLYRQMEPIGGISEYIRKRRMQRCYQDLCDPAQRQLSIGEIAHRWGLRDASSFARQFRRQFKTTPGEVRRQAAHEGALPGLSRISGDRGSNSYEAWLASLGT
ncbi:MAG: helix-turn-helix domain-containing protein [Opitutales bacterium]